MGRLDGSNTYFINMTRQLEIIGKKFSAPKWMASDPKHELFWAGPLDTLLVPNLQTWDQLDHFECLSSFNLELVFLVVHLSAKKNSNHQQSANTSNHPPKNVQPLLIRPCSLSDR
jgi:hypothetical protein